MGTYIKYPTAGANLAAVTTSIVPATDGTLTLGDGSHHWNNVYTLAVNSTGVIKGNGFWQNSAAAIYLTGQVADGAAAVGSITDNQTTLSTAGAKLHSFRNNTVEKAYVDKDGGISGSTFLAGSGGVGLGGAVNGQTQGAYASGSNTFIAAAGDAAKVGLTSNTGNAFANADINGLDLTATAAGRLRLAYTDNSGSPGATTINKASGRAAIASGASAVVVTNSLVTATSIVSVQLETSAAGVGGLVVVPGAGSFTVTSVNGTGAATNVTANAKFSFLVHN